VRLGYLEQTAVSGASSTVKEEVMSRMGSYQAALAEVDAAEAGVVSGSPEELERLEVAYAAFEATGGYTVEGRVSAVLGGLGFSASDHEKRCDTFSGGWQMRIALARLLLSEPELLVRGIRTTATTTMNTAKFFCEHYHDERRWFVLQEALMFQGKHKSVT